VVRRTAVMLVTGAAAGYFVFALWGQSLREGIAVTTTTRAVLNPAPVPVLIDQVLGWVGPVLALAVFGALLTWRRWPVALVLLAGSVLVPAAQIRIGEGTSLAKHVGFGMVFAAPLAGALLAELLRQLPVVAVPATAVGLAWLGMVGSGQAQGFLSSWAPDDGLVQPLGRLVAATPGKPILGDQPAPERYALRTSTQPLQWTDTYSFSYGGKSGAAAYREAIDQSSFGVIYLSHQPRPGDHAGFPTADSAVVHDYLATGRTPYRLVGTVPARVQDRDAGEWLLYLPKVVPVPADLPAPLRPAVGSTG